jgi:hypothetical protein
MIESERDELTALLLQLKQIQQTAGVAEPNTTILTTSQTDTNDVWDSLAFDPVLSDADNSPDETSASLPKTPNPIGQLPIEDQIIALPSNGNTSHIYRGLEITHRMSLADEQLNQIRNLIAEKSFQFSHVIRVSPRKGVTTRARAVVRKLNHQIAEHCRFYTRCRSSLLILVADPSILSRFKVLNPVDVVSSTAVLNPNQPGSTSIKLSWIWQSSARNIIGYASPASHLSREMADASSSQASDPEDLVADFPSLLECTSICPHLNNILNIPSPARSLAARTCSKNAMARRGYTNYL